VFICETRIYSSNPNVNLINFIFHKTQITHKDFFMSSSEEDKLKGRVKESGGALTGNDELKREGQKDQASGKVKKTAENVVDSVKNIGSSDKK
jgi:uncharacterized protein YjbJ (UPF0337 family)